MCEADQTSIVREMIYKENEYINHRMTWLVALQGLLFTALSFSSKDAKQLIWIFALLGTGIALSSWLSLIFSEKAIQNLKNEWEERNPNDSWPGVIALNSCCCLKRLLPWFFVPPMFAMAWVLVLFLK
jgi:hypothetical protein